MTSASRTGGRRRSAGSSLSIFLGYSEPEAGSDLANISSVGVPDGDGYLITGQKSYSSRADRADFGFVIARTDPASERHPGLTLFLVDMALPGITVTRHPTMAGFLHPSVHFDGVRVARTAVIGAPGEGWSVLMGALDYERAGASATGLAERHLDGPCARPRRRRWSCSARAQSPAVP